MIYILFAPKCKLIQFPGLSFSTKRPHIDLLAIIEFNFRHVRFTDCRICNFCKWTKLGKLSKNSVSQAYCDLQLLMVALPYNYKAIWCRSVCKKSSALFNPNSKKSGNLRRWKYILKQDKNPVWRFWVAQSKALTQKLWAPLKFALIW